MYALMDIKDTPAEDYKHLILFSLSMSVLMFCSSRTNELHRKARKLFTFGKQIIIFLFFSIDLILSSYAFAVCVNLKKTVGIVVGANVLLGILCFFHFTKHKESEKVLDRKIIQNSILCIPTVIPLFYMEFKVVTFFFLMIITGIWIFVFPLRSLTHYE